MTEERTLRGFLKVGEFKAQWHGLVRVQESSAAFQGACVWVFAERAYSNTPEVDPPHLHLSYRDAVNLRRALAVFTRAARSGATTEAPR